MELNGRRRDGEVACLAASRQVAKLLRGLAIQKRKGV